MNWQLVVTHFKTGCKHVHFAVHLAVVKTLDYAFSIVAFIFADGQTNSEHVMCKKQKLVVLSTWAEHDALKVREHHSLAI